MGSLIAMAKVLWLALISHNLNGTLVSSRLYILHKNIALRTRPIFISVYDNTCEDRQLVYFVLLYGKGSECDVETTYAIMKWTIMGEYVIDKIHLFQK